MSIDPVIAGTLRVLLALLFAGAAWHKLLDLKAFRIVLHDYEVLPFPWVTPATVLVVAVECGLAAGLPVASVGTVPVWIAIGLLTAYSLAIAINLVRGRRTLECGCGPSAYRQPLSEWLLARNTLLIGVCLLTLLPVSERAWSWTDCLTLAGAVATGGVSWVAAERLLALATTPQGMRGLSR